MNRVLLRNWLYSTAMLHALYTVLKQHQGVSLLLFLLICISPGLQAQTGAVSGKVSDRDGVIPGVSIGVKGTTRGTITDANGAFSIQAPQGSVLVLTAVGYAQKQVAVSGTSLNIVLSKNEKLLNEVVVTALGIKRSRNSLPYAAQQISGAEVNKTAVNTNFVNNLSGKVSGLQITASNALGGSTNAILRGFKSLTQSNQALFVVDGIPFDNTNQSREGYDLGNAASDINADDIESVSVLKGAAASALYGSRASNGVILITTKKGSTHKGVGVSVNFGITAGTPDKSTLPTYQTQYGQGYGSQGGSSNPTGGFFYSLPVPGSNGANVNIVQTNNDAATGPAYNPSLKVYNGDAFTPGDPNFGKATPWQPAAHHNPTDYFVTPVSTMASIFVDNATDKGSFKLGYTREDGQDYMPNSYVTKNLVNLNATYNLTSKLSVGGTANYSDNSALGRYLYQYNGSTSPMGDFRQWWPTNIDISKQKSDYLNTLTNATWNWQPGAYLTNSKAGIGLPAYHDNMYWNRFQNPEADTRLRYFGNINANYKITPYLNLMGRVSIDNYTQIVETHANVGSQAPSFYDKYNSAFRETNYDLLLNFDKTFGKFNIKALLGSNVRTDISSSNLSQTAGGLVIPGFYALGNSQKTPAAPTETYQPKEVDGIFAGATISYKDMITVDGTLRRDKSSTLPKNNNSYYYPAISANFVFSKLLPTLTSLSYGKFWANYSEVGGDAPVFSTQNTYYLAPTFNGQTIYGSPGTNNNPNLLPERNKTYEIGLEMAFLNNRLGFNVDYYKAKQVDQITPVTVSSSTGFNTFYVNGGSVQNSGIELSLNGTPVRTADFSWDITVNFSRNKSKILSLYNNQPSYTIASLQNSIQLVAEVGKSYGIIRGTDYQYLNGQREIDASGHYRIASNSLSDIGNMNPDWMSGITNTFKYKNLAFSFLIDIRKGGQVYSLDMDYGSGSGLYPRTAGYNDLGNPVRSPLTGDAKSGGIILHGVTADGKKNTTRIDESDINNGAYSFSSSYGEADREFVYDASYVKLREASLSYSFPKKMFEHLSFIKGIDFALTGRNLWIIHKNEPYADPEQGQASGSATGTGSGSANASMGFQNGAYPVFRTFGANLKIRF